MKTSVSNSNANPSLIIRIQHEDESEHTKADTNTNPCTHDLIPLKHKSKLKRQIRAQNSKSNIPVFHLCSFVHVAVLFLEFPVMTSMSGVVQFALVKPLAVWGDIEIYADTIGFVVTFYLAWIQSGNFFCRNVMVREAFVSKEEVAWEKKLTTFTCKM